MNPLAIFVVVVLLLIGIMMLFGVMASLFRRVGPNQALIVYGFGGTHIITGGGRVVWPMVQSARELSLELMSFDVAPSQDLYTNQGVAVTIEAVAQIKVRSDAESIRTAAEQFLSKPQLERQELLRLVMEGHLRGIVGQLTIEQIVKDPEMVGGKVRSTCAEDLGKMGLEIVSFTIKEVKDRNEYIENMGKPDIARIRKVADIAAAEADRDTAIRRAETARESAVAKAMADQERVIAETASQTRQSEAQRDLSLKQAEFASQTKTQQATADKAYEIQTNVMQQRVIAEEVAIDRVRREEQIKVQDAEIERRERELVATVLKPAEIDRQRIQTLAEAERQRLALEATGRAEAVRVQGTADAEIIRVKGAAEADIIRAKGEAEAQAMQVKAAAFQEYNQAAVIDKLLTGMPDVVRALSESLTKVDRITIVSTGDGKQSLGPSQITGDIAKMIAQVPAIFETLTGVTLGDLMAQVTPLRNAVDGKVVAPGDRSDNGAPKNP